MHAPLERVTAGIQREPQRLRFRPPEIVQGERNQAEQDRAIATWLRTQIAPMADRSLAAVVGKPIRKPAVALRGLYYRDRNVLGEPLPLSALHIAKRFDLQIPTRRAGRLTEYRWHWYGPRHRHGDSIEIDVAPTTLEMRR